MARLIRCPYEGFAIPVLAFDPRLANIGVTVNTNEAPPLKDRAPIKDGAFAAPTHGTVSPQDSESDHIRFNILPAIQVATGTVTALPSVRYRGASLPPFVQSSGKP